MVRALLWKEWRKLRALRWACVAMGLALPVALYVAAQFSARGWGLAAFAGYAPRTLLLEVVPAALALGLWPLTAMMMTVNAMTADRAEGTETFLLDRPVSRRRVWWTRLLASAGSVALVMTSGIAMVLLLSTGQGGVQALGWRALAFCVAGAVLAGSATLAALGATSLVSVPMPGLLLALVLSGLPLLAGAGGAVVFPHAVWERVPVAALTACALGFVFPLASWLADTRGEPGGRGRLLRASLTLGGGCLLATGTFVVLAPVAVRASSRSGRFGVLPTATGSALLAAGERGAGGGFVIDVESGKERAFLAPQVASAAWDSTGEKLAVVDNAGPLGSEGPVRVRFLDRTGREIWPPMRQPDEGVQDLAWAKDRIALVRLDAEDSKKVRTSLVLLDPVAGREVSILDHAEGGVALHAASDGRVFVAVAEPPPPGATREQLLAIPWRLHLLDGERAVLGPPLLHEAGPGYFFSGLSPSGCHWLRVRGKGAPAVVEIATGKSTPLALPEKTVPRWLAGDVVVWLQEQGGGKWTLVRQRPGRDPEIWTSGETRNAQLWVSPGGERVIVLTLENGFHHAAVLDTRGAVLPPLPFQPLGRVAWAGPRTLAVTSARGRLRLYDVITGKTTVVFGGG